MVRDVPPQAIYSAGLVGEGKPGQCLNGGGILVNAIIITSVNGIESAGNSLLSTMATNASAVENLLLNFSLLTTKMVEVINTVEKLGVAAKRWSGRLTMISQTFFKCSATIAIKQLDITVAARISGSKTE